MSVSDRILGRERGLETVAPCVHCMTLCLCVVGCKIVVPPLVTVVFGLYHNTLVKPISSLSEVHISLPLRSCGEMRASEGVSPRECGPLLA